MATREHSVLVVDGRLTADGWREEMMKAAQMAVAGGIMSFIVWRVAYRRRDGNVPD